MELWAAIDLMGGSSVTLVQGRPEERTVWKQTPLEFAKRWEDEGAHGIHIVDLDAAFGNGENSELISRLIEVVDVPVEVGGGVGTVDRARRWLEKGAARVVVGTMAYRQPEALRELLAASGPGRVVVAADYKDSLVVARGWREGQGISVIEAAKMLQRSGVRTLLSTCVGRDGMASGPDVQMAKRLSAETRMEIISSGGIRDVEDILSLQAAGAHGVILGRALYDGGVELSDARKRVG